MNPILAGSSLISKLSEIYYKEFKMANKLNKNQVGLICGVFLAAIHAIWALLVAVVPDLLQQFLDWVFGLHFLMPIYVVTSFNFVNAILLVALTFVGGFALGWGFAAIWNWINKR
jgi:type II secretory pathway component PulF